MSQKWGPVHKAGYCNSLTGRVLSAVFEVSNTLGAGFLALTLRGIRSTSQTSLAVTYKGHPVGRYFAGLLVEDLLIIEVKCVDRLAPAHTAQCLNYLRASNLRLCLLVNFQQPKVEWKRIMCGFRTPDSAEEPPLPA